jgi:large subunit ribosomal protein MRP49
MTVDRSAESFDPAIMSIHFQTEGSDAEKVETINMKNYRSSEILEALRSLTKASPVEPTPRDLEEQEKMLEQRAKSLQDSKLSLEVRDKIRRERQLLLQARGSMASANDA